MEITQEQFTTLLNNFDGKEPNQADDIYPVVYQHLRETASRQLKQERRDHTLQTTALVHEAYLKMVDQTQATFHNRSHFLAIASLAMRRILISYARKRNAEKRGGAESPITFMDGMAPRENDLAELLDLEQALAKLEKMSERQSKVVQYRFFGGLTYKEIAEVLNDTEHSVRYDWRVARAWLKREMAGYNPEK
ncbi:MAG: ECF-type sigma factor [Balneolaceae bacterium]